MRGNVHWQTPRSRAVSSHLFNVASEQIVAHFHAGIISRARAVENLRETGAFEAEIDELLGAEVTHGPH